VTTAVVALGSNLGDRVLNLETAAARIRSTCAAPGSPRASHVYETPPWGGVPQPEYLNAAVLFETPLASRALLTALLAIETEAGRVRGGERWGPRTIDLDLLDLGGAISDEADLVLPHPRIAERAFVLVPLCEIAPNWRHPLTGLTAAEMLIILNPDPSEARLFGSLRVGGTGEESGAESGAKRSDIHRH